MIDEGEAETVRYIFRRYQELGCVRLLKEDLDRRGILIQAANFQERYRVRRTLILARSSCVSSLVSMRRLEYVQFAVSTSPDVVSIWMIQKAVASSRLIMATTPLPGAKK